MTGRELYDSYQKTGLVAKPGADAWTYAQTLRTAFFMVGTDRLFRMLEQADATGQQIELTHPQPIKIGPSEPSGVELTNIQDAPVR